MRAGRAGARWGIPPFFVERGPHQGPHQGAAFEFTAPTTSKNALRVLRALQLKRSVLLEGSPGVGKTALVAALARAAGQPLSCSRRHTSWPSCPEDLQASNSMESYFETKAVQALSGQQITCILLTDVCRSVIE